MVDDLQKKRLRGRPVRRDYEAVETLARRMYEDGNYRTVGEAVRRAVDAVIWFGGVTIDGVPPIVNGPISLIRGETPETLGSLKSADSKRSKAALDAWRQCSDRGEFDPPPSADTYLDARDTVVEQIATKLRLKLRREGKR